MATPAPVTLQRPPVQPAALTLADYHALPEGPPFYEFENGELIPMNRPTAEHQAVLLRLGGAVDNHVAQNALGRVWPEVEVDLPDRGYVPDLAYLSTDHLNRLQPNGLIAGAPDLVVEVLSPSTARRDRGTKFRAYQEAGVPWLWLVDSEDLLVEEYRLTPDGYLRSQTINPGEAFQPGIFPGLTINLSQLLGRPAE